MRPLRRRWRWMPPKIEWKGYEKVCGRKLERLLAIAMDSRIQFLTRRLPAPLVDVISAYVWAFERAEHTHPYSSVLRELHEKEPCRRGQHDWQWLEFVAGGWDAMGRRRCRCCRHEEFV
jgi:hypothetical protein